MANIRAPGTACLNAMDEGGFARQLLLRAACDPSNQRPDMNPPPATLDQGQWVPPPRVGCRPDRRLHTGWCTTLMTTGFKRHDDRSATLSFSSYRWHQLGMGLAGFGDNPLRSDSLGIRTTAPTNGLGLV